MNVGFIQYKLPNNITAHKDVHISINNELYIADNSKLEYAIDEDDTTTCILIDEKVSSLEEAEIIIEFDKTYLCDGLQVICNNQIKSIKIYDYSNQEKNVLLLEQNSDTYESEQLLSRNLSAILITGLQPAIEGDNIQLKEINVFNNEIEAPEGYYFRDIEIQSITGEEDV